jgi:hypothetical protein
VIGEMELPLRAEFYARAAAVRPTTLLGPTLRQTPHRSSQDATRRAQTLPSSKFHRPRKRVRRPPRSSQRVVGFLDFRRVFPVFFGHSTTRRRRFPKGGPDYREREGWLWNKRLRAIVGVRSTRGDRDTNASCCFATPTVVRVEPTSRRHHPLTTVGATRDCRGHPRTAQVRLKLSWACTWRTLACGYFPTFK